MLTVCPRAPVVIATWLVAAWPGYSRTVHGRISSPRRKERKFECSMSTKPLIDVPIATINLSGSVSEGSRELSLRAIFAAATANWLKRPATFTIWPGIQSFGLNSHTSPTIRHSRGNFDESKRVGVRIPDFPAFAAVQNFSTPTPIGETMPSPVMTGWRFIRRVAPRRS